MAIQRNFGKNFCAFYSGDTAHSDANILDLPPLKHPGFPELQWTDALPEVYFSLNSSISWLILARLGAIPFQTYVGRGICIMLADCRFRGYQRFIYTSSTPF
jgi:hypothetical protein